MEDVERGVGDCRSRDRRGRERSKRPKKRSRHRSDRRDGDAGGNSSESSKSPSPDRHRRRQKSESRSRSHRRDRRKRDRKSSRRGDSDSDEDDDALRSSSVSSASLRERNSKKSHKKERDRHGRKENPRKREDRLGGRDRKKREKKRKHKKDKKRHKKKSRSYSSSSASNDECDEKRTTRREGQKEKEASPPSRGEIFTEALFRLLDEHPVLATELPYMMIRMAGGGSFNLSQTTNAGAAGGLQQVFETMCPFGMQRDESGAWTWKDPAGDGPRGLSGGKRSDAELVLVKIARALLDGVGVTAEAVEQFEQGPPMETQVNVHAVSPQHEDLVHGDEKQGVDSTRDLRVLIHALFDKFCGKPGGESLPSELGGVFDTIAQGESVALDGIPDEELRIDLENLFVHLGLVKTEIEEEEESEDDDEEVVEGKNDETNCEVTMGYGLPDGDKTELSSTEKKVLTLLEECKRRKSGETSVSNVSNNPLHKEAVKKRPVQGPAIGPFPGDMATNHSLAESSSEDEGPAPVGSDFAKKMRHKHLAPSNEDIQAMAEQRRLQLADVAAGGDGTEIAAAVAGGREEWMVTPGEHDFLKGIKSGGGLKSRQFKNEKTRGDRAFAEAPMNPKMRAEIEAISQAHAEARGPSLMEEHRRKKAEAKEAERMAGAKEWKWSRDKHLDEGRRVDKKALNMIMGGASSLLKEKFHGSF